MQEERATQTTTNDGPIAGWAGLLLPYDRPSVDGRIVYRPNNGPRIRDLPLELKFQHEATDGHDGAVVGLASITRVWETDEGLWASGEFDQDDPRAKDLARKIHNGFLGHVSVDLGDFSTRAVQGAKGVMQAVTDWMLLSATIVADAAMNGARIFTVSDPAKIRPTAEALAARRVSAGVAAFSVGDRCSLTFASQPGENTEPDPTPASEPATITAEPPATDTPIDDEPVTAPADTEQLSTTTTDTAAEQTDTARAATTPGVDADAIAAVVAERVRRVVEDALNTNTDDEDDDGGEVDPDIDRDMHTGLSAQDSEQMSTEAVNAVLRIARAHSELATRGW